MDADIEGVTATYQTARATSLVGLLVGLVIAVVVSFYITSLIVPPLRRVMAVMQAVGSGDLSANVDVTASDEVGQVGTALNEMIGSLRSTVEGVISAADTLAGSAEELSAVSTQLGSNANETSAQAGVVSAAAEQVSANVQTVATSAEEMRPALAQRSRCTRQPMSTNRKRNSS